MAAQIPARPNITPPESVDHHRLATLARLIKQYPGNASHAALRARRFPFGTVPHEPEPGSVRDAVFFRLTSPELPPVFDPQDTNQTVHVRSVPYGNPLGVASAALCGRIPMTTWSLAFGREVTCPICRHLLTAETDG